MFLGETWFPDEIWQKIIDYLPKIDYYLFPICQLSEFHPWFSKGMISLARKFYSKEKFQIHQSDHQDFVEGCYTLIPPKLLSDLSQEGGYATYSYVPLNQRKFKIHLLTGEKNLLTRTAQNHQELLAIIRKLKKQYKLAHPFQLDLACIAFLLRSQECRPDKFN